MKWLRAFLCRYGFHKWVDCTIKWESGGPYMEWWMCDRCGILNPVKDGDKWEPFTVEKDNLNPASPEPL